MSYFRRTGAIAHVAKGVPYFVGNGLRAIRASVRRYGPKRLRRFKGIDIDLNRTKNDPKCRHHPKGEKCTGHDVGVHFPRPLLHGFYDPRGLLAPGTPINLMTLDEALRLRAKYKGVTYAIQPIEWLLRELAAVGQVGVLEPKDDERYEHVEPWNHIAAVADDLGAEIRGYSLRDLGGPGAGTRRVKAMRAAGIPAHTI